MHTAAKRFLVDDHFCGLIPLVQPDDILDPAGQLAGGADHAVRLDGAGDIQQRLVLPQFLFDRRRPFRRVFGKEALRISVLGGYDRQGLRAFRVLQIAVRIFHGHAEVLVRHRLYRNGRIIPAHRHFLLFSSSLLVIPA